MSAANSNSLEDLPVVLKPSEDIIANDLKAVERLLLSQDGAPDTVTEVSNYVLGSGGKRIRPMLVLLVAKYCGYEGRQHIDLAGAIEALHTASLLHDDVLDASHLRRGKLVVNRQWDDATSILMGDYFHTKTFQLLVGIGHNKILKIVSKATGDLIKGEIMQLEASNTFSLSEDDYKSIINHKTATLFEAATHSAAILAGAKSETEIALKAFGLHFGLSYQLIDDFLDYAGSADQTGKGVGNDLAEGKITLPLIYALNQNRLDQNRLCEAIKCKDNVELNKVVELVKVSGGLKYTQKLATLESEKAQACLASLAKNKYQAKLLELTRFALQRHI